MHKRLILQPEIDGERLETGRESRRLNCAVRGPPPLLEGGVRAQQQQVDRPQRYLRGGVDGGGGDCRLRHGENRAALERGVNIDTSRTLTHVGFEILFV